MLSDSDLSPFNPFDNELMIYSYFLDRIYYYLLIYKCYKDNKGSFDNITHHKKENISLFFHEIEIKGSLLKGLGA